MDALTMVNFIEADVLDFAGGLTDDLTLLALKRSDLLR